MSKKIAKVLLGFYVQQLDRLFDYIIPDNLLEDIQIGARVIVPFQNRLSVAYVWELAERSEFEQLKEIKEIVDIPPLINEAQFQLINWLAEYYFCSRVDVVKLCLPPGANLTKEGYYQLTLGLEELQRRLAADFSPPEVEQAMGLIASGVNSAWSAKQWAKKFQNFSLIWEFLISNKILIQGYRVSQAKVSPKVFRLYQWAASAGERETPAGSRVKDVLLEHPAGMARPELCAVAEVSDSVINRLFKEGKLVACEVAAERRPVGFEGQIPSKTVAFNPEQQQVYQLLATQSFNHLFLLHGVTGSGKTELYFELAAEVLKNGLQVLYLVPEISLTPQTLERARSRFGDQVALLHSNMSDGERFDQWFKIKQGEARFVLGARSAIFAPFDKLGLIIVDEEHEVTYKQEETPRYHARLVVEKLAEIAHARVIFGSATPSIETFNYAQTGKYTYLQLKQRFNRNPLPEVTLVNMRDELQSGNKNILSQLLFESIQQSLDNHEQVILLLNRRGHSTFILCRDCGQSLRCQACDVSLTYHLNERTLRCHYCDYRLKIPDICPNCRSNRIRYFGHGTQKLEEELAANFNGARIIRMDLDSTARKGAHHDIYRKLTGGEVDILLGTQMIAKGLDLPRVTLVGVISADSSLNVPDFRASERCFHLLTQVAGRAGRGEKLGRVIFQTYNPEHYSLQFAKDHDYHGFYEAEIARRLELNYPPFSELIKIGFTGLNLSRVSEAAQNFSLILKARQRTVCNDTSEGRADFMEVLGPAPSLIPKIQDKYRWQMLLKSNNPLWLEQLMKVSWEEYQLRKFPDVRVIRDRNPYSTI
jgi:primosomal protein N' (replication factor Y) (superfamily II helicase)